MISGLYYVGRAVQLLGMWILLVALFTAGPLGPSPRLFGAGIAVFAVGWVIVRQILRRKRRQPGHGAKEARRDQRAES